jgi:hypothetical protein
MPPSNAETNVCRWRNSGKHLLLASILQFAPNPDIDDAGRLPYGSKYIPDSHGMEQRQYRPSQTPINGGFVDGGRNGVQR